MAKPETFNERLDRFYAMQSGLWGPQNELEADIKTILRIHELTDPKNLPEFETNVLLHVLYPYTILVRALRIDGLGNPNIDESVDKSKDWGLEF